MMNGQLTRYNPVMDGPLAILNQRKIGKTSMVNEDNEKPKQPLPQYRRKLDAKIPLGTPVAPNPQPSKPEIQPYVLLTLFIGLMVFFYFMNNIFHHHSLKKELMGEQRRNSYVRIMTVEGHPGNKVLMQLAVMYGFRPVIQPPTGNRIQIIMANGKSMSAPEFIATMQMLPVRDFHPGAARNTIYLYGVEGCPYAQRAESMLKARGIKYIYVDLNNQSDPAMDGFEARIFASGYPPNTSTRNPYLEYNGKIYQNPDLYNVIPKIK